MSYRLVLSEYRAALYIGDATLSVNQLAEIIHAMSQQYLQDQIEGLEYAGREWLK